MNQNRTSFFSKTSVVWIGAFLCCALWGSAFPCIKTGYHIFSIASGDSNSQILFAGVRFFLAGILAVLFGSIQQKRPLIPRVISIPKVIILALFQTIGQYVFFYIGLAHTTAVKGSIISGSTSFFSIVLACIFLKNEKMSSRKLLGCILGFSGLVAVNLSGSLSLTINLMGDLFMIISTVSSALSALLIKVLSKDENTVMLSGYQFMLGGFVMILLGLATGGKLQNMGITGIALLIYMALISSVAYTLWGILIKYNSVSRIAIFGFIIPIMGTLLSALFLQEYQSLNFTCIIALALVCTGIFIVNKTTKSLEKAWNKHSFFRFWC